MPAEMARAWTRAVIYRAPGVVQVSRLPRPAPAEGEILLRLSACGLCGTDLYKLAHGGIPPGTVLGHEIVGTIAAIGDGVEGLTPGQRIVSPHHVPCGSCRLCLSGSETLCPTFREDLLAPGGFSEWVLVRARAVRQAVRVIPDTMPDEVAIFLEPAACVLRGCERSGLPDPGDNDAPNPTILVLGAGSMGLLHVLVLRALYNTATIVISDPLPGRRDLALQLGVSRAISPEELPDGDHRGVTEGFDAVFDTVGRPEIVQSALELTREGGSMILFAHGRPDDRLDLAMNSLFKSERRLIGTYSGGPGEQQRAWDLLASGRLDPSPLVTHHLPLDAFETAVTLARDLEAIKVLLFSRRDTDAVA